MIRAAIVGIGWWGRMLVNAVQGKSAAIRFTAGYTRTRATAEGFCAEHSIALANDLHALLADPRDFATVRAVAAPPTVAISIEELQRQIDMRTLPVTEIENLY